MALDDGTHGEEAKDSGEAQGTGNDARVALLNRISDENDQRAAEDFADVNDDGTTSPFVVRTADGEEVPLKDESATDGAAAAEIDKLAEESGSVPSKIKIKVNGREIELTQDELIERAQKVESADMYLAEAARLRTENARNAVAANQATTRKPVVEEQDSVEEDLAIARAIQMGTEEEAVAALRKLRTSRPSVTADDVRRTVDSRLTFNEAIQQFRSSFKDIASDPVLNQMAIDADARLLAQGDKRPYAERYTEIGNEIRGWADRMVQARAPVTKPTDPGAEKLARKAAASPIPKAASTKSASTVEPEKEESTSDIIASIAKSRGGPQWMNDPTRH
jgi:hypothetical protein